MTDFSRPSAEAAPRVFASQWWAQRWIDVLESFGWTQRLARGRNYARGGNVLEIDFRGSKVQAKVQGTASHPYDVSLGLEPFSDEEWEGIIAVLAERAIFAAKLLAGEMPQNIEEAFTAVGKSLFPFTKWDIQSRCSCPDSANPCKHIAAVYYLMGERFDQDPFVLFALRGRTRAQLIERLRVLRGGAADHQPATTVAAVSVPPPVLEDFWTLHGDLDPSLVVIAPPPGGETVLDVLGPLPIEHAEPTMHYLRSLYGLVRDRSIVEAMGG